MYSALKRDGKALYEYAREGVVLEREGRTVEIMELELALEPGVEEYCAVRLRVKCSKGTYIRTLAEDIGEALGCGAHLTALRRVRTGGFGVDECVTLAMLEAMSEQERLECLRPVEAMVPDHTLVTLGAEDAGRFLNGLRRRGTWPDAQHVAVWGEEPRALLGTAHIKAGELIPGRLLSPVEIDQILKEKS
jgi:tRNA pseudouridine55 synthase